MNKTNLPIYSALLCVSFLWGTSFAAAKIGMHELAPLNLVTLRFIIASAVFAGILLFMRENNTIDRGDIPRFFLLGFLAITSYFYIQYTGLLYTTTIHAALIIATSPLCAALMGAVLGWERVSPIGAAGILVAFAGVSLIITNGQLVGIFQSQTLTGDFMLLINAIVWAGFTLYGKTILKKYRPFVAMAYIHIFGTVMLLPFAFIASPLTPLSLSAQLPAITWPTVVSALYLALLCSIYSYYVWYSGVEKIGAVRTAAFAYFNPLFAAVTGILLLHEAATALTAAGGVMVIAGVYLTNRSAAANQPSLEEKP
ncbi:MAG: DMT family transporter [Negativicutes bacterium]|nr:DMT family transporter [Negativicutes bacterium]